MIDPKNMDPKNQEASNWGSNAFVVWPPVFATALVAYGALLIL